MLPMRTIHQHLRLFTEFDQHPDDHLLELYESAAVSAVESYTQLALMPRQLRLSRDKFPSYNRLPVAGNFIVVEDAVVFDLPVYPVISIDSFTYVDGNGDTQAITNFELDTGRTIARVRLEDVPDTKIGLNKVSVEVTAGFADPAEIPAAVKHAALLMIGQMYEHRENVVTGTIATQLPAAFEYLLHPHRVIGV